MEKQNFTLADPKLFDAYSLDELAGITPGWLHLNSYCDFSFLYVCPKMQLETGISHSENSREADKLYWKIIHPATRRNFIKSWRELSIQHDNELLTTTFQQLKLPGKKFEWFITNSRLHRTKKCIVSITNPLNTLDGYKYSLSKILDDTHYLKKNLNKYDLLTNREKEIVSLMVQDNTMCEVAGKLFISELTAKTHRKNIYRKLKISNLCELMHFAYIYGLI